MPACYSRSMPVFRKGALRLLYVHVPKTGGTAIEMLFAKNGFTVDYLDRSFGPDSLVPVRHCSPQHMHAAMLETVFRLEAFDACFMTVRHPVARLMSEYRMRFALNPAAANFPAWLASNLRAYAANGFHHDNHFRPQGDFWFPAVQVLKYEEGFGEGLVAKLEAMAGSRFAERTLDVAMRVTEPAVQAARFDETCRPMVERLYAEDYTRFGYAR